MVSLTFGGGGTIVTNSARKKAEAGGRRQEAKRERLAINPGDKVIFPLLSPSGGDVVYLHWRSMQLLRGSAYSVIIRLS